jgi:hypothetical protein
MYCGASAPNTSLEVDHVVALVDGGTNDEGNLVTACYACNRGKEHSRRWAEVSRPNVAKHIEPEALFADDDMWCTDYEGRERLYGILGWELPPRWSDSYDHRLKVRLRTLTAIERWALEGTTGLWWGEMQPRDIPTLAASVGVPSGHLVLALSSAREKLNVLD